MLGNIQFLTYQVSKKSGIPQDILLGIYEEYWDTFRNKLQYSNANGFSAPFLGTFFTDNSKIRGYARQLIRDMRYKKSVIIKAQEEGRDKDALAHTKQLETMVKKFKAAWGQIEIFRRVFINNKYRWAEKYKHYKHQGKWEGSPNI